MTESRRSGIRLAPYGMGFLIEIYLLFFFGISVVNESLMNSPIIRVLLPVIALAVMATFAILKRNLKYSGSEVHVWPVVVGGILTMSGLCFFIYYLAQTSNPVYMTVISGALFGVGLGVMTAYWVHAYDLLPSDDTIKCSLVAMIGSICLAILLVVIARSTEVLFVVGAVSAVVSMISLLVMDYQA